MMLHKEMLSVSVHNCVIRFFHLNTECNNFHKQQTERLSQALSMKYINETLIFVFYAQTTGFD